MGNILSFFFFSPSSPRQQPEKRARSNHILICSTLMGHGAVKITVIRINMHGILNSDTHFSAAYLFKDEELTLHNVRFDEIMPPHGQGDEEKQVHLVGNIHGASWFYHFLPGTHRRCV